MLGFGNQQAVPELVDAAAKAHNANGDGTKYIFPCAPPAAKEQAWGNFWYRWYTPETFLQWPKAGDHYGYYQTDAYMWQSDNDHIDTDQWTEMLEWIADLVKQEVQALGDASKVIVGGKSQGGTVAIDVALNYPDALGALLCLRTCPMRETLGPLPARPLPGRDRRDELEGLEHSDAYLLLHRWSRRYLHPAAPAPELLLHPRRWLRRNDQGGSRSIPRGR